ncbi:MAG TPA: transporter substrate-binding domain-containing protein [Chryseosolibacter sp.]
MKSTIITVGLDHAAPVPLHTDYRSGTFVGFEVDILHALADRLHVTLNYHISYWKDIVRDLQQGKTNLVCSAATVSADKENIVSFSRSYLNFHLCTVVNTKNRLAWSALQGKKIGVREDSEAKYLLMKSFPEATLILSDSNDELYSKLRSMEVDALVDDSPIAHGFTVNDPNLQLGELIPGTESSYAIMVRKNDKALLAAINNVLQQLEEEGQLEQLKSKWFNGARLRLEGYPEQVSFRANRSIHN